MAPNPEITPAPTRTAAFKRDTIVTVFSTIEPDVVVTPQAEPKKPTPIGPIVGGLIGGIAAGALACALVWWCVRRRKREHERAARAFQRRRQRQIQAAQKTNMHSTSSSINSAQKLYSASLEKAGMPFDPNVAVAAPPRAYGVSNKDFDPFKNERGYGYEPQPYGTASSGYPVQPGFEQHQQPISLDFSPLPDHLSPNPDDYIVGMAVSTDDQFDSKPMAKSPPPSTKSLSLSPPSEEQSVKRKSARGAARAAVAEKAAAALSAPVSSRHRPSRPSPLAMKDEQSSQGHENPFASPPSSTHSPSSSGSSDPYAAAATGQWAKTDRAGEDDLAASGDPTDPRTPSGQYSYDPFAEYHQYVARNDDEYLADPDQDTAARKIDWI